jgi:uncharacterized protein YdeI (YjbR/CyaY-like superfamily)
MPERTTIVYTWRIMAGDQRRLDIATRKQWRAWLAANHAAAKQAWLTIHKKNSARPGLRLAEAVEEALCFGWIDGAMHSLGAETFALRFSPRRAGSVWSAANQRRVKTLIAQGRMTKAGLAKIRTAKQEGEWSAAIRREDTHRLPEDLEKALAADKRARENFVRLPPSHKKRYIWWITGAKQPATRSRRIRETVRLAAEKAKDKQDRRKRSEG